MYLTKTKAVSATKRMSEKDKTRQFYAPKNFSSRKKSPEYQSAYVKGEDTV